MCTALYILAIFAHDLQFMDATSAKMRALIYRYSTSQSRPLEGRMALAFVVFPFLSVSCLSRGLDFASIEIWITTNSETRYARSSCRAVNTMRSAVASIHSYNSQLYMRSHDESPTCIHRTTWRCIKKRPVLQEESRRHKQVLSTSVRQFLLTPI